MSWNESRTSWNKASCSLKNTVHFYLLCTVFLMEIVRTFSVMSSLNWINLFKKHILLRRVYAFRFLGGGEEDSFKKELPGFCKYIFYVVCFDLFFRECFISEKNTVKGRMGGLVQKRELSFFFTVYYANL